MTSNHQPVLTPESSTADVTRLVDELYETYQMMRNELAGVIVGMDDVTEQLMIGILCRGHCMLQGMPGLAKTLLISQLASLMHLTFNRIQFTPDLMPGDITGSDVLEEDHTTGKRIFRFLQGPLFANLGPCRRNQSHAAQNPKRAARGNGRTTTLGGRKNLSAAGPFLRARNAKPR